MPPLIAIRVDGNETIGMGHVMRCLSLADALSRRHGARVVFVTRDFPAGARRIERADYTVLTLRAEALWTEDRDTLVELAGREGLDAIVTDLRELEPGYLTALKSTGAAVAVIDEWGRKEIDADLLTNGTAVPAWHAYTTAGPVRRCVGPAYTLLEPSFVAAHDEPREIRADAGRLLIALGGDDPFFLTRKVLAALELVPEVLEVTVVIGPAFVDGEEVERAARGSRHRCVCLRDVRTMAQLMMAADVALVGGGLTALEAACAGVPAVIICEVDHQVETADALEAAGTARHAGLATGASTETIAALVQAVRRDVEERRRMSAAGKSLVDGRGLERVAAALMEILSRRGSAMSRRS